jgi:hypothetical protein
MGTSAAEIGGSRIGAANMVPFFTRSDFAERFGIDQISMSKCDIAR